MGRIGSGVLVSASFQIFVLRVLLHSTGVVNSGEGGSVWVVISQGDVLYLLEFIGIRKNDVDVLKM